MAINPNNKPDLHSNTCGNTIAQIQHRLCQSQIVKLSLIQSEISKQSFGKKEISQQK